MQCINVCNSHKTRPCGDIEASDLPRLLREVRCLVHGDDKKDMGMEAAGAGGGKARSKPSLRHTPGAIHSVVLRALEAVRSGPAGAQQQQEEEKRDREAAGRSGSWTGNEARLQGDSFRDVKGLDTTWPLVRAVLQVGLAGDTRG